MRTHHCDGCGIVRPTLTLGTHERFCGVGWLALRVVLGHKPDGGRVCSRKWYAKELWRTVAHGHGI